MEIDEKMAQTLIDQRTAVSHDYISHAACVPAVLAVYARHDAVVDLRILESHVFMGHAVWLACISVMDDIVLTQRSVVSHVFK